MRRAWALLMLGAVLLGACTADRVVRDPTTSTPTETPEATSTATPADAEDARALFGAEERAGNLIRWVLPDVDITSKIVSLTEIEDGGVGADGGIPSLHYPEFVDASEAADWLDPREPVIVLEVAGEAKIYPIQILIWHEVVNDELGGIPILVTFCPLCYSAIAFDRRVEGEERRFGVSGLLRESDLLLYDYQTTTLWQQLTGEGIVGSDAGLRLDFLPAQIVAFEDARTTFPDAPVLSRETGYIREYGANPYAGYDDVDSNTIFTTTFADDRLPAKARVLAVEVGDETLAFPFDALSDRVVIHSTAAGVPVVAFWQPGTAAALDTSRIVQGRDVGAAGAFVARIDGVDVSFEARDGVIVDAETGSEWNVLGVAVAGPLAGQRLEPLQAGSHFWFVWSIFKPDTRVVTR